MKFKKKSKESNKHMDDSDNKFVHKKKSLIRRIGSSISSFFLVILVGILYIVEYVFIRFLWEMVIRNIFLFVKKNFKNICIFIMTVSVISISVYCLFLIKDISEVMKDLVETMDSSVENINNKLDEQSQTIEESNKSTEEKMNSLEEKVEETSSKVTSRGGTVRRESNNSSTQVSSNALSSSSEVSSSNGVWTTFNVSAYCGCSKCCGKSNAITASGAKATQGITIAASSNYKFGTKIYLEGLGTYTVQDRGGAIKGNKIDVYFDSHSQALAFGRKNIRGKVIQ